MSEVIQKCPQCKRGDKRFAQNLIHRDPVTKADSQEIVHRCGRCKIYFTPETGDAIALGAGSQYREPKSVPWAKLSWD